jgi:hypothetical protein
MTGRSRASAPAAGTRSPGRGSRRPSPISTPATTAEGEPRTPGPDDQARPARAIDAFFSSIDGQSPPLLANVSGTIRFDLSGHAGAEHWYVTVSKGRIAVSHKRSAADAVVHSDRALFEDLATGRSNAMAAWLRGALVPEGQLGLVVSFQRLFPGPPRNRAPEAGAPPGVAPP